jgi:hypothetical protein
MIDYNILINFLELEIIPESILIKIRKKLKIFEFILFIIFFISLFIILCCFIYIDIFVLSSTHEHYEQNITTNSTNITLFNFLSINQTLLFEIIIFFIFPTLLRQRLQIRQNKKSKSIIIKYLHKSLLKDVFISISWLY